MRVRHEMSIYEMMGVKNSRAIMRNARMPFVDEGHCITKAQQAFVSIHGGIPCNLAPAHFTVHIAYAIKLRSRVCRGGESCMRSFFACCVFMYLYGSRFLAGGGKSDPPPALSSLLSYRFVHVGAWRSFRLPEGFSSLHKILSWKFWTLHGFG